MVAKKHPRPPAPSRTPPAKPTSKSAGRKQRASKPAKPTPPSKGAALGKVALKSAQRNTRDVSFAGRVEAVERGTAVKVAKPSQRNQMGALPSLPDLDSILPDMGSLTLPELGKVYDPIEEAASDVRVFGPDLDESPIEEDDETLTHEDREAARLAQLHAGFRSRMEAEAKRRELATDSEFWFTVVFQDRDQKDQFLRRSGLEQFGDKYLDGERVADHLGVAVDKSEIAYNIGGADPKLVALVGIDGDYGSEAKTSTKRKQKPR